MLLLMQQDDGLADDNPLIMMQLMRSGGLSSNPLAMMAMMGGGKKMNPFLMSKLLQCTQPNNPRHEVCGIAEDEYHYSQSSGRLLLPCCTCKKTEETIAEMYVG